MNLRDKAALVTGGNRGIGRAIAEALLAHGASVFVCGRTAAGVGQAVAEMKVSHGERVAGQPCDVRDPEQVSELMDRAEMRFGGIDVLVNNAGVGHFKRVEQMSSEQWRETLETNLSGVFYCCRAVLPCLKRRGGGYIINIGSLAGKNAFPEGAAYNASKFGLIGFSEALMQEVRFDHIRVSYIMPGSVNTEFGRGGVNDPAQTWKLWPEDVADVVVRLLEMDPRALPSRVELRPSEPARPG